jgi:hypothetical protein
MPRLLTKLKVDSVDLVRRGAGADCKVCIAKADYPDDSRPLRKGRSFAGYPVEKRRRSPPFFQTVGQAKAWLFGEGRMFRAAHRDTDLQTLAEHLLDASGGINKKAPDMDSATVNKIITSDSRGMTAFCKTLVRHNGASYGGREFDKRLQEYATNKYPDLKVGKAIEKAMGERDIALAYRATHDGDWVDSALAARGGGLSTTRTGDAIYDDNIDMLDANNGLPEFADDVDYTEMEGVRTGRNALREGGQQFSQPDDDEPDDRWSGDGENDDDDSCEDGRSPEYKRLKKAARAMVERGQAVSIGKALERLYLNNHPLAVAHAKQHRARAAGY